MELHPSPAPNISGLSYSTGSMQFMTAIAAQTKTGSLTARFILFGGAEGDRTPGLMTASHALSQLSYSPERKWAK